MQTPAGESGAHAGRDKKQSNPTRKLFDNLKSLQTVRSISANAMVGDNARWSSQ